MIDLVVSNQFLAISNDTHTIAVRLQSESCNVYKFNRSPDAVTENVCDINDGNTSMECDGNSQISEVGTVSVDNTPLKNDGNTLMVCDSNKPFVSNGNLGIVSNCDSATVCDNTAIVSDDSTPIITNENTLVVDGNTPIVSSSFSICGKFFVCCCQKDLSVWNVSNWTLKGKKTIQRSANKVIFSPSNSILVADKSGDVYLHLLDNFDKPGTLLLGHVSMLLDVLVTPDEKYIITCDRDEKIRVSLYAKPYIINSYCLGHEDFVTFINLLCHDFSVLVSSGGDGTIRLWSYKEGKQLVIHYFLEDLSHFNICDIKHIVPHQGLVSQYDSESSLLYLSVFKVNAIIIHLIKKCESVISCMLWQIIKTEYTPISFQISVQDKLLWVLVEDKVEPLKTFKLETNCYESDPNDVYKLSAIIEKYLELLKDIELPEWFIKSLAKKRFDNESEYYNRKHKRLEKIIVKK